MFARLIGDLDTLQIAHSDFFGSSLGQTPHQMLTDYQVIQHRHMGKQIKGLKYHAHFGSNGIDIFEIIGQLDTVNNDSAGLVNFKAVNAADQGRFS